MTDIEPTIDFLTTADGEGHPTLPPLTLERGGDLPALLELLNRQQTAKMDLVVAADRLRYEGGKLVIAGGYETEATLTADGVTAGSTEDLHLSPTAIFEDQIASRLEIPQRYVRRIRADACEGDEFDSALNLLDRNVNHWLEADPGRLFTVRGFYDPATGDGIARAILSGRYEIVDHLDQLAAVLGGLKKVGEVNPAVAPDALNWKVDLTERNLRVRVIAPQIEILRPDILGGYKDPWQGRYGGSTGETPPVLQAGLDIRNSETGGGAWVLVPFLHVLVCSNGLTRTSYAVRRTHIGGEKTEGRITYSLETQRKVLDLITSQTADAVAQYLSVEWLTAAADEIAADAATPIDDAKGTLEKVAAVHKFSEIEKDSIFELFLMGGQRTAGGVAQAITAHAHTASPTRAMELDDLAVDAMFTAARFASV